MSLWSEPVRSRAPTSIALYALVALLAIAELVIFWLALHPDVPDDYRAYYLDRTTTCLPQPVTGEYTLGTPVDFRSGGPNTRELRPCGWEGPAGDGMHAVGETSRLRFNLGRSGAFVMTIGMTAVSLQGPPEQRVVISGNGTLLETLAVPGGQSRSFQVTIPDGVVGADGILDIALDFPEAILPGRGDANTRKRSIKLTDVQIIPAS